MGRRAVWLALALILALAPVTIALADAPATQATGGESRPRIGLVLSGGGARGLAHVGVLKVLEENRIPIDMIAGTSAGSIIAGLYAMGLSASEIETVILGIDWNEGFSDASERKYRSLNRKNQELGILTTLEAGLDLDGLKLPKGLLQGQRLEMLLRDITAGAELIEDFDQLPIPYRAVATNIENGARISIGHGDIVRAMHASMAIPGVYAPVEIDGEMLVDGGLASNLPIQVVRDMGADIIIAIDISTPLNTASELSSVLKIAGQVSSLLTQRTVDDEIRVLRVDDTLITPDLTGYSSANFDKAGEIIRIGEQAARDSEERLARYRLDETAYADYRRTKARLNPQRPIIDEIVITSNSHLSQARLASYISIKPGERFDPAQLETDIAYLYGLGYFSRITYQLDRDGDEISLLIDARKKAWGPNYLRAGLGVQGNLSGDNRVDVAAGLLVTEINTLGAEWLTDASFGENSGFTSNFFQPLGNNSNTFIDAEVALQQRNVRVYAGGKPVISARVRSRQARISLGHQFGNTTEVRLGIKRRTAWMDVSNIDITDELKSNDGAYELSFLHDTLDNTHFPRHGNHTALVFSTSRPELGADDRHDLGAFSIYQSLTWGKHTLQGHLAYADTITSSGNIDFSRMFQIGGFLNLSGYEPDEISGSYTGLASLIYFRQFNEYFIKSASVPIYIGASLETGNAWQKRSDITLNNSIVASSIFLGADTYIGPIYLGYGFNSKGRQTSYLYIGRIF